MQSSSTGAFKELHACVSNTKLELCIQLHTASLSVIRGNIYSMNFWCDPGGDVRGGLLQTTELLVAR